MLTAILKTGSSATFDPVEQILPLDGRHSQPRRIKILNRRFVFLHYPLEYGYPHGATVLLNIATGEQTHLLPPIDRPGSTYQVGFPFRNQVDPFITPSHYVQVVNTKEISFYDLNEISEANVIPDPSQRTLRPSHFGIITLNLLRNICIIPRSPSSFVIFGIQTLGNVLFARILTVYLGPPSSTDESGTDEVRVCVNSAVHELWGRVQNVTIPPVSPSSGTALGMIFLKDYSPTTRRWEEHCLSVRIALGCPLLEPDFLISRMNVMGTPHDGFNFHGFDPYAGRILAAYFNSEGRTRRLFALDFLPSRK
ncbi:hypothetical protein P691DRAFT_789006 [Macrolepiota fuliginosa MF-IS2]|uniref:Uncharacterized protein n=1 Tax=Macrolepiota fuliginosa MF-IS2 TaxID=1400762 RepID=A0A9P6C6Q6_9AGAR|nr:hypothetical protein P691DRAFT_789006 [Macrolepiota fuliginosa MF-IS2]